MNFNSKIFVAGHRGLAGSAILRKLTKDGYNNIVVKSSRELDLTNQSAVDLFFSEGEIEYVFLAAAKVGGILANNTYKGEFIYKNLMIQSNVMHASYKYNVKKLLFLGSSCIYPKLCEIPIKEDYLLTGPLEATNQPYAIAKIAGIEMCSSYSSQYGCNFIKLMPTNLYGENDNYHPENSHVLPALLRRFIESKHNNSPTITIWGSGTPMREFLHVDDLADACVYFMNTYNGTDIINIGSGKDISIKELAYMIKDITEYNGEIIFDTSKPDGTHRKLLDTNTAKTLGWTSKIELKKGIKNTYDLVKETLLNE